MRIWRDKVPMRVKPITFEILPILSIALSSTLFILATRHQGWFAPAELNAYDQLYGRLLPERETCDVPVALVEASESDLQKYGFPLPGTVTSALIERLLADGASVIGFNLHRNIPVEPGHQELLKQLQLPNVVTVEFIGERDSTVPAPPEAVKVGAVDVLDDNGVFRHLPVVVKERPAFSTLVASTYLQQQGRLTSWQQLAEQARPFATQIHTEFDILVPWQRCAFRSIKFAEILEGAARIERGDIVIIGQKAESVVDPTIVPYNRPLSFNAVYAHLVVTLLNLEAGTATPVRVPSQEWLFAIALSALSLAQVTIIWVNRNRRYLMVVTVSLLISGMFAVAVVAIYVAAFHLGTIWLPVIPALLIIGLNLFVTTIAIHYAQLRDYTHSLEREVTLRTEQLVQQRSLAELGGLLRGVVHDLNSPLSLIENYTLLLQQELSAQAENDRPQQFLNVLSNAATAIFQVIETLSQAIAPERAISHALEGIPPTRKTIELGINIVSTSVTEEVRAKIGYRRELSDRLPSITASQGELLRITLNLVGNAVEALQRKSEADPSFRGIITVRAWNQDERLQLEFADNGPGLPESVRESLAAKPSTSDFLPDLTRESIGLWIVAQIVEENHGTLAITSSPEMGTAIAISLPALCDSSDR